MTGASTSFSVNPDAVWQALVNEAMLGVVEQFASRSLRLDQLAVTLIDSSNPAELRFAQHRGDHLIYPASVVKLFYLVAAHQWLEEGKLSDSEELQRALRDMVVDSSNDATSYIVDMLTGTTSGPELPLDEFQQWLQQREAVNRYFASLGYRGINVNRKTWAEGPYGRDMQAMKAPVPNPQNRLTTNATARLLAEIMLGRAVSESRSAAMQTLLRRDPQAEWDKQAQFTGPALPPGAKLWSKGGWTSRVRHDAAYMELPDGRKLVVVTFTEGHAEERDIIPALAKRLLHFPGHAGSCSKPRP